MATKSNEERTYIMVKPDGVQRGLMGEIIKRFEKKGFKLVAMKFTQPSEELLKQHYADLSKKPFFSGLVKFMATSPVCCMVSILILVVWQYNYNKFLCFFLLQVWEGLGAVATGRQMLGETDPVRFNNIIIP